jgi:hypothetical protein
LEKGEKRLLNIMNEKKAEQRNPIPRALLRSEAKNYIKDTRLLGPFAQRNS